MIWGLSGKKQVGKDLIANIIKYFVFKQKHPDAWATESFLEFQHHRLSYTNTGWAIVKFADKLKDIVCLILGCTREQLEDEIFKNTPLGKDWVRYKITYEEEVTTQVNAWSTHTDLALRTIITDDLEESLEYFKKYKVDYELEEITLNPRQIMQFLGTDFGRNMIHPSIWINSTMANYTKTSNWIISDVRFPGEVKAIHDKKGIVIRINRPSIISTDQHESETALDDYDNFDYVIENVGDIPELIEKVKDILILEGIIN